MRKLQHQLRLQGREARIDPNSVARHAAQVRLLWQAIFD
jgi:hypothetical protein